MTADGSRHSQAAPEEKLAPRHEAASPRPSINEPVPHAERWQFLQCCSATGDLRQFASRTSQEAGCGLCDTAINDGHFGAFDSARSAQHSPHDLHSLCAAQTSLMLARLCMMQRAFKATYAQRRRVSVSHVYCM